VTEDEEAIEEMSFCLYVYEGSDGTMIVPELIEGWHAEKESLRQQFRDYVIRHGGPQR
jgi:hypothetical protein